jgi:hypothetical protein
MPTRFNSLSHHFSVGTKLSHEKLLGSMKLRGEALVCYYPNIKKNCKGADCYHAKLRKCERKLFTLRRGETGSNIN